MIPLCILLPNQLKSLKFMNTESSHNPAAAPPVAAPGVAPTTNVQPVAANAPQSQPDTAATAPSASQATPPPNGDNESAALPKDLNWRRRLRPQQPLVGVPRAKPITAEPRMAEPCIGEHDLLVQGSIKLTSRAGQVIEVPINTTLSGSLSQAFLPLAEEQFQVLLDNLLVTPAKVAFIAYLEDVKAERKAEAGRAKQDIAAEQEQEHDAARELLNRKGKQ